MTEQTIDTQSAELEPSRGLRLSVAAAQRSGLSPLRHVSVTGSTNDDLANEARRGMTDTCVLVADHQTAGKGRLGRSWYDTGSQTSQPRYDTGSQTSRPSSRARQTGSLLVSFRLNGPLESAAQRVAAVSAATLATITAAVSATTAATDATAVEDRAVKDQQSTRVSNQHLTEVTDEGLPATAVRSKWPNDLVIESPSGSGKLAGVLAEIVNGTHPVVVVGLGLNLAPVPQQPDAASLQEVGITLTRDELLSGILSRLPTYLTDPARARDELLAASATVGCQIRAEQADGSVVVGRAVAIDESFRLVVDTHAGLRTIETADIHHLRATHHLT